MLITTHWSATSPSRLRDYHLEFGAKTAITDAYRKHLLAAKTSEVDFAMLHAQFEIYKNVAFDTATDFGTYHLNHDPRDGSPNIEIGALCMGGEGVSVSGSWGAYPYTIAHAWMHAALIARVGHLKGIDLGGSFGTSVEPGVLQNGPIFNVSTHAERALQTVDRDADGNPYKRPGFGYFIYSGDPDCRYDQAALDFSQAAKLADPESARSSAIAAAAWLRARAHEIKAAGIKDFWGLDLPAT
jgi:hypothetical protein